MAHRSPARYLAPLALAGAVVATVLVVERSRSGDDGGKSPVATVPTSKSPARAGSGSRRRRRTPRTYTVRRGDTLSEISARTGVAVDAILRLNPRLDPQALSPGQTIRLRR